MSSVLPLCGAVARNEACGCPLSPLRCLSVAPHPCYPETNFRQLIIVQFVQLIQLFLSYPTSGLFLERLFLKTVNTFTSCTFVMSTNELSFFFESNWFELDSQINRRLTENISYHQIQSLPWMKRLNQSINLIYHTWFLSNIQYYIMNHLLELQTNELMKTASTVRFRKNKLSIQSITFIIISFNCHKHDRLGSFIQLSTNQSQTQLNKWITNNHQLHD